MKMINWKATWEKHYTQYKDTPPRTGIFLHYLLRGKVNSFMEVACGSGRDSNYLAGKNYRVVASDYQAELIDILKTEYKDSQLEVQQADAFSLPFSPGQFDVVFHNGFVGLFQDDQICQLLKEQERVAKKYLAVFVHNRLNDSLFQTFQEKVKVDELYNIRFFTPDEIKKIVEESRIKIKAMNIFKFGGKTDALYRKRVKGKYPNPFYGFRDTLIPGSYSLLPWRSVERILCLIELNKED